MKAIRTPIMAIIAAAVLVIPVGISTFQQQVIAPDAADYVVWRQLTHEFEKDVINTIGDPNEDPVPHLRPLLEAYAQGVMRIFGDNDAVFFELTEPFQNYQEAVLGVFSNPPPEGDKRQQHDQIKEFRQLTHGFETQVKSIIFNHGHSQD